MNEQRETARLLRLAVGLTPAMNGITVRLGRFSSKVTVTVTAAYRGNANAVRHAVRDRLIDRVGVATVDVDTVLRTVEWVER